MSRLTPTEYVDKHARRLKAATEDIKRGIDRVTEAPGAQAVQKEAKMKANLQEALDSGKWARNTGAVSLEEWKTAARDKGVGRIGAGIEAAKGKNLATATALLAAVDAGQAKVNRMADDTFDDSLERMVAFSRHMKEAKIKG